MSLSFWIRDYVFLPLAMLRREVWWRNLRLVISMVCSACGTKPALLFRVVGLLSRSALVLHRQAQGLQRKYDWNLPPSCGLPLSWIATIA